MRFDKIKMPNTQNIEKTTIFAATVTIEYLYSDLALLVPTKVKQS
jgi:hypothetical protein